MTKIGKIDNRGIVEGNLICCKKCILNNPLINKENGDFEKNYNILKSIIQSQIFISDSRSNQKSIDIISNMANIIDKHADIIKSLEEIISKKDQLIKSILKENTYKKQCKIQKKDT